MLCFGCCVVNDGVRFIQYDHFSGFCDKCFYLINWILVIVSFFFLTVNKICLSTICKVYTYRI